jgi:pimeloyl-ACP methyl ester carboxylesterase
MLMYVGAVAEQRGATVHRHTWSGPPPKALDEATEGWVCEEIAPLVGAAGTLLIGKSLGSYAARLAAERELPAVWLTPVFTVPWVPTALRRARAPFLLVGGTADPMWDGALARRLTPHVLEVDGAGHGMTVPGPMADSIAVLGRMVTAVEDFLGEIGWPG